MIDFNPACIYHLADGLSNIEHIPRGTWLPRVSMLFAAAAEELRNFLAHQQHTIFPDTAQRAAYILSVINSIQPADQPVANRLLTDEETMQLIAAIQLLLSTFEAECSKKYIVGLERQRALEPYTLVEAIDSALSPECWKHLSRMTKAEIEEFGKCLAFERYTASGFHILRGVEVELRDYVCLLTKAQPAKRDWGYYIQVLKDNTADTKLIATLDSIRTLDRNPLMHPEDWLDQTDAIGIFNTSQTALERLIADMGRKKLLPALLQQQREQG